MPIYEFECKCGNCMEKLFDKPVNTTKCPECGRRMNKILSPSNFQLKGHCWAKDSYGLKEQKKKSNKLKPDKKK